MNNTSTQRLTNDTHIVFSNVDRQGLSVDTRSNRNNTAVTIGRVSVDLFNCCLNGFLRTANTVTIVIIITSRSVYIDNLRLVSKRTTRGNTKPVSTIPNRKSQVIVILQPRFTDRIVTTRRRSSLNKSVKLVSRSKSSWKSKCLLL